MYPKKSNSSVPREKHEQIKALLINKFRSKYCTPYSPEADDLLIVREVNNFLQTNIMTEKGLT